MIIKNLIIIIKYQFIKFICKYQDINKNKESEKERERERQIDKDRVAKRNTNKVKEQFIHP
jgi:hypothetical protein